jgi:flavin-dependent dehydrogenase
MPDVCIVGGGPAGATLALRLARLGHSVVVHERATPDRDARGESLHPGIHPLLETLGLTDAGALRVHHSLVRWGEDVPVPRRHPLPQLAVLRPAFDARLLDAARAAGAVVSREEVDTNARVVVDASGRSSWSRPRRTRTSERMLGLRGTWRGSGLPREMRVEAAEDGWIWGSPMPDGSFAVIACVDADPYAEASRYFAMLRASELFRDLHGTVPVQHHDATTYASEVVWDEQLLRIGDASHSLDPLSSSGIRSAMQSALHASIAIHTILRHPERTELARRFYTATQRAAVEEHTRWTRSFYNESRWRDAPFWQKRAAASVESATPSSPREVTLADGIAIDDVPCVVGDFVESRRGVTGTARPFVWIGGAEAAALLRPIERGGMAADALVASWRGLTPHGRERAIFDELLRNGVLVSGL